MTGGEAVIRSQNLMGHTEDQLGLVHETLAVIAAHAHMAWAYASAELLDIAWPEGLVARSREQGFLL